MRKRLVWSICVVYVCFITVASAQSAAEQIPSATFASLDGYTEAEISPDGAHIAYLYPLNERQHLIVHQFESGANKVIPPIEGLDFLWLHWANDETVVFAMSMSAVRQTGILVETEETRLIGLNISTKALTPLIKPAEITGRTGSRTARDYYAEAQLQDDVIDWMPDDPDHIRVSLDEDFDGRYEVRQVDINSGDFRTHRKSIEGVQNWIADQSGEIRLGYGYRVGDWRVVFKDANGDWLTLDEVDWFKNGWSPRGFSPDPEVIYVSGWGEHGTREYRTVNTTTGEFGETLFSNARYDASGLVMHPRTLRPIGVAYTDNRARIAYFDPEFEKLQASIDRAIPNASNTIRSVTVDMNKIVIQSSSSQEPGMLLIWDRAAKTMEPFGWFNETLDPELVADVKSVEYASADGTIIPAYLTLPIDRDATDLPAVVLPHGGPTARIDSSFWFLTQFLVSRGYAVLEPNFRGSSGYGGNFRNAGRGQWGGVMQDDVDAGARWLAEQGIADANRICIVGWSYGGYSAAMGLVKSPDLYRCGVGINGPYNLPQMITDSNKFIGARQWTRHIGLDGEGARAVSPHHQAEHIKAPFLIIHSEDDHRVQVDQADNFYHELMKNDKRAQLVKTEHGGHSMVNATARQTILDETEAFLDEHIGAASQ